MGRLIALQTPDLSAILGSPIGSLEHTARRKLLALPGVAQRAKIINKIKLPKIFQVGSSEHAKWSKVREKHYL